MLIAGRADVAQLVEHVLGKDGVSGSIPLIGSRDSQGAALGGREGFVANARLG